MSQAVKQLEDFVAFILPSNGREEICHPELRDRADRKVLLVHDTREHMGNDRTSLGDRVCWHQIEEVEVFC